jgi:hypothetical protein
MSKEMESWIEGNFQRVEHSMPGSSISVEYIPKKKRVTPWPTRREFSLRRVLLTSTLSSILIVLMALSVG